jgi:hypothetical protein
LLVAAALLAAAFADEARWPVRFEAIGVRNAFDAGEQEDAAALRTLAIGVREAFRAAAAGARAKRALAARAIGVCVARIETESARAAVAGVATRIGEALGARAAHGVAER